MNCNIAIIGAGPYGLAAAAHLRAAGLEPRIFGEPMAFWAKQMPFGMCLRSSWDASNIADPSQAFTLNDYCRQNGNHLSKPIPLDRFVDYGRWFQRQLVPDVDSRQVQSVDSTARGLRLRLHDGEEFHARRIVIAAGIATFVNIPAEFRHIPVDLASHTTQQTDLRKFRGQSVVVIGSGQSALESAALLKEAGAAVEVIGRQKNINWVGLHPKLHHLGIISKMFYSPRDVGPAGISRLVSMPHVFRRFPRGFQDRTAYRAIRPAGAGWLQPRIKDIPITLGRSVRSATVDGSRLRIQLSDGTDRLVDHALLATGFRVDVSKYPFLSESLLSQLQTVNGYPVLKCGLESSLPGLHFIGKTAAWSFGPLLGFVSGAEFASNELLWSIGQRNGTN